MAKSGQCVDCRVEPQLLPHKPGRKIQLNSFTTSITPRCFTSPFVRTAATSERGLFRIHLAGCEGINTEMEPILEL